MQQNNEELQRAMYEEYQGTLRRTASMRGIPADYVDDIVQDTFVAYFTHYSIKWTDAQKKAMLMKILRNKVADYFRKAKKHDYLSMDADEFDETAVLTEYIMKDTLDFMVANEQLREVRETIFNMKKEWLDIAVLHIIEQRPIAEVCQILELDSSVCRMRLSRIRKYLRAQHRPKGRWC